MWNLTLSAPNGTIRFIHVEMALLLREHVYRIGKLYFDRYLARLYPFTWHSRGSQSSGSAVRWEFPPCRVSRVTCQNGSKPTSAGVPRPSHPRTWAGLSDTIPLAGLAARARAPLGPPTG